MNNVIRPDVPASVIFDQTDDNFAHVNITAPAQSVLNSVVRCLVQNFTYQDPKKLHSFIGKKGFVKDCNVRAFDKKTQSLYIGLIPKAANYLKDADLGVRIGVSDVIRSIYSKSGGDITKDEIKQYAESLNIVNSKGKKLTPYEHQVDICHKILNGRRISTLACTSSGKSLSIYIIARYLIEHETRKVLIITPSKNLVVQLFNNFVDDYGWKDAKNYCSLIYGESKEKVTDKLKIITISTWQSLQRQNEDFFKCFTGVIVDEAHSTRGEVLRDILGMCTSATNFKVGLSGTLPDDGLDSAYIEGSLGRKETIIKTWQLIEMGILPPMKILSIRVPYKKEIRSYVCGQRYQDEYFLVTNNGSRKAAIDLLFRKQITPEQNTLILYKNKTTLDEMFTYLKEKHPNYKYHIIKGEVSTNNRTGIFELLENTVGNIIVATYGTMKQGVNIPLLHNLVLAEFSKSMYEIVQGMGRVARYHPDKKESRVFDIFDDCSYMTTPRKIGNPSMLKENYSVQHYNTRLGYYNEEKIPITEFSLEGIYEAGINTDALEEKQKLALEKAEEKSKKTKKKSTDRKKLGDESQFA